MMNSVMINHVIARWHQHMHGEPGVLDELLDDDVIFYSPVVYTPQRGKEVTKVYLAAAVVAFVGDVADNSRPSAFVYTKQVVAGDTAVLEFESLMVGKYINGVDIIRVNEAGRIVEFHVMIRPLQAVNTVHRLMGAALDAHSAAGHQNSAG
jgi:hypothetical protein